MLFADAIKPWQPRSWISPRDSDFEPKTARVLDLHDRTCDGQPLGADEYVISANEKSQLKTPCRRRPILPAGPGRIPWIKFEYRRGGSRAHFAACDVHRAHVSGRIAEKTGIVPFEEVVEQVMTVEPYQSDAHVFWVVDYGSSHNGTGSIERMTTGWPTADLVHLPVHVSC